VGLDKLLAEHDERLVIVMGDIDRLTDPEIRDVMRLVRLVGDFPNTTYVLAYASKAVARALGGDEGPEVGQAYLEKIVQVTHAVPAIDPEHLSTLLLGRIDAALAGLSYELDREHWSSVYMGMRPYFRTLRDVLRYANAVRSPAKHLVAELDVADILGLEALRIFEPATWNRIDELAEPLTKPSDQYLVNHDRDAVDEQIRDLAESAARLGQVRELLRALFPVSQRALGRSNYGSDFMGGVATEGSSGPRREPPRLFGQTGQRKGRPPRPRCRGGGRAARPGYGTRLVPRG
jgi:predicted KAP-like P-loop ATPase